MSDLVGNPEDRFSQNEAIVIIYHYANMPMQHVAIFICCKIDNFPMKNVINLLIFAQNIDRGFLRSMF